MESKNNFFKIPFGVK